MPTVRRISKMKQVLSDRQLDLTVVCENIHDSHNVSAILRTCDAVGVQRVALFYTVEPFPELGKKSSASASKWIDTIKFSDSQKLRDYLKSEGMTIYGTYLGGNSISVFDVDWTQPSAIILGNEQRGISEEALSVCDQRIHIPMFGMIESLNVSVAAAVILYEATRQRLEKKLLPNRGLSDKWVEEKLREWSGK